jgi:hypothetical protein
MLAFILGLWPGVSLNDEEIDTVCQEYLELRFGDDHDLEEEGEFVEEFEEFFNDDDVVERDYQQLQVIGSGAGSSTDPMTWDATVRSHCGTFDQNIYLVPGLGLTVQGLKESIANDFGIDPLWITLTCDEVAFHEPDVQLVEARMKHFRVHASERVANVAKMFVSYKSARMSCKLAFEQEEGPKSIEQQQQPPLFGLPPAPTDEDVELEELRSEALATVDRNRKRPSKEQQAKLWNELRYNLTEFERANDTRVTMAAKRRRVEHIVASDEDCEAVRLLLAYCGQEWTPEAWRNALMHPDISIEILNGIKAEVTTRAASQADRAHKVLRCIPLFKNLEVFIETIVTRRPLNASCIMHHASCIMLQSEASCFSLKHHASV